MIEITIHRPARIIAETYWWPGKRINIEPMWLVDQEDGGGHLFSSFAEAIRFLQQGEKIPG